jgi:hypothetical protein
LLAAFSCAMSRSPERDDSFVILSLMGIVFEFFLPGSSSAKSDWGAAVRAGYPF